MIVPFDDDIMDQFEAVQRTVELRIPNPEQFKKISKGDQVEATFTQAVAIAVQPTASK